MKIGFDIDDTLNNVRYCGIDFFNDYLGKNISYEKIDSFNSLHFHEPFGITLEEQKEIWKKGEMEIYWSCNPLPFAVETLQKWHERGHEIYYITARKNTPEVQLLTIDWLKSHGFPFLEKNFHIGMKDKDKSSIVRFLNLDCYFEDKPAVIEHLIQENLTFYIKDQCYNRHFPQLRFQSWKHAISNLKELE